LLLNNSLVSAFAVSVLPTPVGHINKKLPSGFHSSFNHALALLIAFETAFKASSCHTTFSCKYFSIFKSLSFSVSRSLVTGTPVHLAIISAISSLSTLSLKKLFQFSCRVFSVFSEFSISFSAAGISEYLILATSPKFHSLSKLFACIFRLSIFSLKFFSLSIDSFSFFHADSRLITSSFLLAIFFSNFSISSFGVSFSLFLASNSIDRVLSSFSSISISTGFAGSFLSLMYLIDRSTAVSMALSVIFIQ
jgi:hypothetical protein